jgi:anti-sigma factor RsiW
MGMNPTFGRAPACERAAEALSLRLDDELSEHEEARLRAHLQSCAACGVLEREVEALTSALRTASLVVPSRPVAMPRLRGSRVGSLRPVIAAAATIVVVVGSVGSLMRAGFQGQAPGSSLRFRTPTEQIQFASRVHARIEPRVNVAQLPAASARARLERQQVERAAAASVVPTAGGPLAFG